jgi:hypothetical protein
LQVPTLPTFPELGFGWHSILKVVENTLGELFSALYFQIRLPTDVQLLGSLEITCESLLEVAVSVLFVQGSSGFSVEGSDTATSFILTIARRKPRSFDFRLYHAFFFARGEKHFQRLGRDQAFTLGREGRGSR